MQYVSAGFWIFFAVLKKGFKFQTQKGNFPTATRQTTQHIFTAKSFKSANRVTPQQSPIVELVGEKKIELNGAHNVSDPDANKRSAK